MKRAFISLFFFAALASVAVGQNANDWFITVWDMSKPTYRINDNPATTIAFPGIGSGYKLYWEDADNPTPSGKHGTVTVTTSPYYLPVPAGTTKVRIKVHKGSGTFSAIDHNLSGIDPNRLIAVEQWGTTQWATMNNAFYSCNNMDVTATDKPNLSQCNALSYMFKGCSSLVNTNGSISNWNTENIIDMNSMFNSAFSFNQPLNNWNTAKVTNMSSMFNGATSFNQPLNSWNTANVTNMAWMFCNATLFNQPLNNWNTAKVTDMGSMFNGATSFNQPLNSWNTTEVTNMEWMFYLATSFNQPLNSWNTAKVTNMSYMFGLATSFNQPLNSWNTANVTNMSYMFNQATSFNQPLNSWNTANVTNMSYMFQATTAFDQPLDNFRIDAIASMGDMLEDCGMSCENRSSTLDSWANKAVALGKNNINLGGLDNYFITAYYNQMGQTAIAALQARGWTITGGTYVADCLTPNIWFTTLWDLTKPTDRTTNNPATTIAFPGIGSGYTLYWEDVDDPTPLGKHGIVTVTTQPYYLPVPSGTTKVRIKAYKGSGTFSAIDHNSWNNADDTERLIAVEQWGTTVWSSMENAFLNCGNMDVTATDKPNLSQCNDLSHMFRGCSSLVNTNGSISNWNTENIIDMRGMFIGATSFNQPIGNWNTGSVTHMAGMFWGATSFNQPLTNFDTKNVTSMYAMFQEATSFNQPLTSFDTKNVIDMSKMFREATSFNQPLTNFDTKNVTNMSDMFREATSFNQPLTSFDTKNVINMSDMFYRATSFNQPLGSFKIDNVTYMAHMLYNCGMSCQNLSSTLDSWKTQAATLNKNNIDLGDISTVPNMYNETGRDAITALTARGWTITGGRFAPSCISPDYFVTEWDMAKPARDSRPDAATSLRTNLLGTNFVVEYINLANPADKGKISNANGSAGVGYMLTGLTAGAKYRIIAYPNPDIAGSVLTELQSEFSDQERLIKVTQWGTNEWTLLSGAFQRCVNMDVTATDIPHYVGGISLNSMFAECSSLVYNTSINNWNLSDVTDLARMFRGAVKFNQPIGNWNTGSVSNMAGMFQEATSFNQSIDNWSTGNVTDMSYMFYNATAFDQPLNSWRTENVTDMNNMFNKAYKFNKDISSWNTAKVTNMSSMFRDARAFNQPLNSWNTSAVTDMSYMFDDARAFNQPLNSWNTAKVTNMSGMFAGASVFNQPLNNWDVSKVTRMAGMFTYTRDFNQDISSWNTESVTDMAEMFYEAVAFNQPLNSWNTAEVTDMKRMFFRAYKFNQPLSNWNTAKVTRMSDMFSQAYKFNQDISSWNTAEVTDMSSMFEQDSVFNQDISGWNTAKVTDMNSMFYEAFAFNQPLNSWNTANVTDMSGMFEEATSFNQPLSNWNTEKVTNMRRMFLKATSFNKPIGSFRINAVTVVAAMLYGCGMSCQNLSSTLDGWATQAAALGKNNVNLGDISTVPNAYNETGQAAINTLKNNHNWTITGGQFAPGCILPAYYVSEWDLSKPVYPARPDAATTLVTNLLTGELGCTVVWENLSDPTDNGIGTFWGTTTNPVKLTGLRAGAKYRVIAYSTTNNHGYELSGLCAEKADNQRLIKVTQWGTTQWTSLTKAFWGCYNVDITATDKPDLSVVTDLSYMFQSCGNLVYNTSINDWDVSHITNMSNMFAGSGFNQDISGWNVSAVTNMSNTFSGAIKFNQPLNSWDVSHVTNMSGMFGEALKFNQPLNSWNVSNVTNMNYMFAAAIKFNQNINSWDVSNVTDMSNMFGSARDFNQPLNNWTTSKVTNMSYMFGGAEKFDQDINSWDVSKVTNMESMFNRAKAFDKPLNNWDVSSVNKMTGMFGGTEAFNQDITGWNVSAVTNMQSMFERALVFNQDIKGWNTRNVTDMRSMFKQAAAFDRDLGLLRIDALTNGTEMFASSGMSCDNYSKTLKGWAESSNTPANVNFATQTGTPYGRHGKSYRDKLVSQKNWTISGDNLDLACSIGLITPDVYVSEWDMSKPHSAGNTTELATNFLGTNFVVEYINLADPTDKGIELNANGAPSTPFKLTGLSANAKYRLIAYANPGVPGSVFKGLDASGSDAKRLSKVTQWGTNEWKSLTSAFYDCENMDVTATDRPTLTGGISLVSMFRGCTSLVYNPSINNWGTADVTNMSGMFTGATSFNQPIGSWNTGSVTDMGNMFSGATSFNQPIGNWNTGNVTDMAYMFEGATSFNQPINWNVQNVILMRGLLKGATSFNKPFGTTFASSLTNTIDISRMFEGATSFNQPIVNWNTVSVNIVEDMFYNATSFDQPLDGLKFDSHPSMGNMLYNSGISCHNLSVTFDAWATQATALNYTGVNLILDANKYYNTMGQTALNTLTTAPLNWTINGGTFAADCLTPNDWFVTVWDMTKPTNRTYNSPNTTIAIPAVGRNFKLYWEDVNNPSIHDTVTVPMSLWWGSSPYCLPVPAGTTKVRIKIHKGSGILRRIMQSTAHDTDYKRLITVEQWGTNQWTSMEMAFCYCENMDITANDVPDLSAVKGMHAMFWGCRNLVNANGSMSRWNTEHVDTMTMVFLGASSFNCPIGNWNTANVTDMSQMFFGATLFNQDISGWNTEKVTNMSYMFGGASSFNQPLNNWKTRNVKSMGEMFQDATSFNQPLDSFKIDALSSFPTSADIFKDCGMSCENLSTTLDSWKIQAAALNKNNISLGDISTVPNMYNEMGRDAITALTARGWTITGGRFARDCVSPDYYVSVWDLSKPATTGTATDLATNLWGSSFRVEWKNLDDGTTGMIASATATTAPLTITGLTAGKRYRVVAYPNNTPGSILKKLATEDGGGVTKTDVARLDSVTQWGVNKWMSLEGAFRHCSRMDVTATDVPDLTGLTGSKNLNFMFEGCENLVYNSTINNWVTTGVTDMSGMFSGAKAFNQPLNGWDVSSVKYMTSMFFKAEAFNQDLNSWQTGNVERMQHMFNQAKAFNGDISSWNTGKVTNMQAMFYGAEAFNKSITGWNTANVTDMSSMFQNAKAFTGGGPMYYFYGSWNVEKVTTMENMFAGAESFSEDLGQWTLRSITNMKNMFSSPVGKGMTCSDYSHSLHGWARNPHTNTGVDFTVQSNRVYNAIGKIARDSLMKPIANGGRGWTISGDSYDELCGMYVWTGTVSTDVADNGNWLNGKRPVNVGAPGSYEYHASVFISHTATNDLHITPLPATPPYARYWLFDNLINRTNKKVVVEPGANLYVNFDVYGSSTPADADKIVVKADDTNPNGTLILGGQPCDKPVYATVEMYSKAYKSATPVTWTDNIPTSPTKGDTMSASYKWQYIGVPVDGEVVNAFYGSYLRKYDETVNSPDHYYGKWRKLGADETWQPLEPFTGYEVTSRSPKVYVFKGRLLHCPQELTLTRQAAEVTAVASSVTDPRYRRWELGRNLFGNSYTSALNISNGKFFVDLEASYAIGREPIEATVYIYNTGSVADWNGGSTGSGAGQYVAVPMRNATLLSEQYISSMQGFMLKFNEDTLRIKGTGNPIKFRIGLTKQDFTGTYPFGGNQQPQRAPQADPSDLVHGFLKIGLTSRRSVSSVHLVEAEGTTDEFDNGWDGMQLNTGRSSSATLFVPSTYGDLQVSTSDNIVGDRLGIVNNGDTAYRLTVIRHSLDNRGDLYLYDVATNRYTLLAADTTVYDFTSEGSGNVDKRFVITDRRNADDPNTAVDEVADDLSLYGYVDGRHTLVVNNHTAEAGMLTLLDVSGKAVYTSPFGVGFSRHDLSHLPAGVYIARLEASVRRATVKAITMK